MEDAIKIEGELYISSNRAAKEYAYTKDYIGQMARSGRVKAKRVGRNWYVRDLDLRERDKHQKVSKDANKQEVESNEESVVSKTSVQAGAESNERYQFDTDTSIEAQKKTAPVRPNGTESAISIRTEGRAHPSNDFSRRSRQDKLLADLDIQYHSGEARDTQDLFNYSQRPRGFNRTPNQSAGQVVLRHSEQRPRASKRTPVDTMRSAAKRTNLASSDHKPTQVNHRWFRTFFIVVLLCLSLLALLFTLFVERTSVVDEQGVTKVEYRLSR